MNWAPLGWHSGFHFCKPGCAHLVGLARDIGCEKWPWNRSRNTYIAECNSTRMCLESDEPGMRIDTYRLAPISVHVFEPGCFIPVEANNISLTYDFDLQFIPLARNQS